MEPGAQTPRVLVIRGGAIGDFILTLPAIKLLRDNIHGAHMEVLGYKPIIELAVAGGIADSIRNLEHATMARWFAPKVPDDDPLREYFGGFNLIVSYLYDPDSIFRANVESTGARTFIEASHQVEAGRGSASAQLARPLERLAMFLEDPEPQLPITPVNLDDGPVIAIHPGSGSLKKNWSPENWSRLIRELAEAFPRVRFAIVTGEAEVERGIRDAVMPTLSGISALIWDQMPLVQLAAHLRACSAFIGHDSGISHLAAACGLRCLLLFGPTDPATWAPPHKDVRILHESSGDLQRLSFDVVRDEAADFVAKTILKK